MKHIFVLFMLFALGSTELIAKPVASRKSKKRKKGPRKSRKVSNRKKRTLGKKSGKKPKGRQTDNISHSSKRRRSKKKLRKNLNLSTSSNSTVGVLPEINLSTEIPKIFTKAKAEINWRSIIDKLTNQQNLTAQGIVSRYNDLSPWSKKLTQTLPDCSTEISRLHFFTAVFGDLELSSDVPELSRLKELATALYASDGISADTISSALTKEKLTSVFLDIAKSVAADTNSMAIASYRHIINNDSFDPNSASQTFTKKLEINPMASLRKKPDDDIDWSNNNSNYWKGQFEKWFFPGFDRHIGDNTYPRATLLDHAIESNHFIRDKKDTWANFVASNQKKNWLSGQQEVSNNGVAGDNSGFNCGVMSVFSPKLNRKKVAVDIATKPELASVYLSNKSDPITSFSNMLKSNLNYWEDYSKETETIEGLTIHKKDMIESLQAALSWSQQSQPSDGEQKEKNTAEFLQDFFASSAEAKRHEKHLHQALILAPNPNVTYENSDGLSLRSDKNVWFVMEIDVGLIFPCNNYLRACAILAKANIIVFPKGVPCWTLVPYVNSSDPQSVTLDTVVMQHTGRWHYMHYEPKGNRENVEKEEKEYNLEDKSPHALYQLNKIPFADHLLNEMHKNYKDLMNELDPQVDSLYSKKLSKTIETLRQKISKTPPGN